MDVPQLLVSQAQPSRSIRRYGMPHYFFSPAARATWSQRVISLSI
jgi:hypothetical protein